LWYPKDSGFDLTGYSDADHAGCHLDRKTESEYVAVSSCCAQVLWMRTQLTDYGFFYDKVPIYCDSKSAIAISCNPVQQTRTKHIDAHESSRLFIALFPSRSMGAVDTCLHLSLLGLGLILCFHLSRDMVTHTIDTVASVLTQRELDHLCNTYNISADLRPKLPGREDTIRDASAGKIGIYTRFLESANFHVLRDSIRNVWMSFSRRGPTPCCLLKKCDSLKNWNDHFFWIDASICLISVPWHTGVFILKDPLPSDNRVNAELLALLDHHRTVIRRYLETFLCLVGLSCSFDDALVRPTLLKDNECDIGLVETRRGVE
nr:hypothetical protein [Tanacetum cinerariifolium]